MFEFGELNNTGYTDLVVFTQSTIELVMMLVALLAVVYLIWAGFSYIMSGGDQEKADKAQRMIIYTVVGLVIAFISPLVVRFILENIIQSV